MSTIANLGNRISAAAGALFGRSNSPENPSVPLSAADPWWFGAEKSSSGTIVGRDKALTAGPIWRAVNLISDDVGKLPLHVVKRQDTGGLLDTMHPVFDLLRNRPNPEMSAFVMRKTIQAHVLLHGNGYIWIERDAYARPIALWPLNPDYTYPVRENGVLQFVSNTRGHFFRLDGMDVLHIIGLAFDGIIGYPVVYKACDDWGLALSMRDYGAKFFRNSARPSVVIEHPGKLTKEAAEALKEMWNRMYQGIDNQHRTAVLQEGMKINPFSINASEAQLLESRAFSVKEIANWFGIPPHKLGDSSRTAYNSIDSENQAYLNECLDPWLINWEQECNYKLLTEQQKRDGTHLVRFDREELLRSDLAGRSNYYAKATAGNPWLTIDEVRAKEGLPPLPDGAGQKIREPLNMKPAGTEPDPITANKQVAA